MYKRHFHHLIKATKTGKHFQIIIIIIIITVFKSQWIWLKHSGFTNWGDYKLNQNKSNQNVGFWWEGKTGKNLSEHWVENQPTQSIYGGRSSNWTHAISEEGECFHHNAYVYPAKKISNYNAWRYGLPSNYFVTLINDLWRKQPFRIWDQCSYILHKYH